MAYLRGGGAQDLLIVVHSPKTGAAGATFGNHPAIIGQIGCQVLAGLIGGGKTQDGGLLSQGTEPLQPGQYIPGGAVAQVRIELIEADKDDVSHGIDA